MPAEASIATFEDLLTALEGTSGVLADTIDVVPLEVQDMRASWRQLQTQVADLPDPGRLAAIFGSLQEAAARENRTLLEISSVVALGAVRAGLQMGHTYLFSYYRDALQMIAGEGLLRYLRRVSAPYLSSAAGHFSRGAPTLTERLLHRWAAPQPDPAGDP